MLELSEWWLKQCTPCFQKSREIFIWKRTLMKPMGWIKDKMSENKVEMGRGLSQILNDIM